MKHYLLLFVAGGIGALARHSMILSIQRTAGIAFPIGTFLVNILGCLIFGFVWSLAESRQLISPETRTVILAGFVGAFTTYSTFAFDTHVLASHSAWLSVLVNTVGQILLGVSAIALGLFLGRAF